MLKVVLLCSLVSWVSCHWNTTPLIPMCHSHVPKAKIDTALLSVINEDPYFPLVILLQSQECYECHLVPTFIIIKNCTLRVDSRWPMRVEIRLSRNGTIDPATESCSEAALTRHFQEGSVYSIYIDVTATGLDANITCMPTMTTDAADSNIPIYIAIGLGFLLVILWYLGKHLYRKGYIHRVLCFWSTESMMSDLGTPTNINQIEDSVTGETRLPIKERLKSLDTFRGISIVIMIFVNYGGGKYWFFKHSKWNGITVADLVFPWFVFIMGTAMAFSFQSQLRRAEPKWKLFLKIVKRSIALFLLGLLINSFGMKQGVDFDNFRIPGVLQRFAITYFITATVFLLCSAHKLSPSYQHTSRLELRDITPFWIEWLVNLTFVMTHLLVSLLMAVPGCPSGYLGPGGLAQGGQYFNCTGGIAGYIDRQFFGPKHIYQHPTCTEIYHQTLPYDPEGILGTLNSCFICFLGLQAGKILIVYNDWVKRCRRFCVWAIVLGCLGILTCKASLNDGWIPINKNLWSLSFVLVLAGMAFLLLLVCYIVIDVFKGWSGAPFYYAGMNSIALYCGHEFFSGRAPVSFIVPITHASLLTLNLWGTTFWVLVSIYFYCKNIFISV